MAEIICFSNRRHPKFHHIHPLLINEQMKAGSSLVNWKKRGRPIRRAFIIDTRNDEPIAIKIYDLQLSTSFYGLGTRLHSDFEMVTSVRLSRLRIGGRRSRIPSTSALRLPFLQRDYNNDEVKWREGWAHWSTNCYLRPRWSRASVSGMILLLSLSLVRSGNALFPIKTSTMFIFRLRDSFLVAATTVFCLLRRK